MKKARLLSLFGFVLLFTIETIQAGWITGISKAVKTIDEAAIAASKASVGAKSAGAAGVAASEIDDAAKVVKSNSTPPSINETESLKPTYIQYPWASNKLAVCISKNNHQNNENNIAFKYCIKKYQSCLDERKIKPSSEIPNEACINQANKE
jgi:hypothetical protein